MSLLIPAENKHLWIHRTADVQHGRASTWPTKHSSSNYHSWKGDVKYSCIYLATSAMEVCAFSVLAHIKDFILSVRTLLLWVTSTEVSYHRRNTWFEIPTAGRWFDSHKAGDFEEILKEEHFSLSRRGAGHRGSSVRALLGLLGFSFLVPSRDSSKGQIPETKLFWTEAIWLTLTQLPNQDKMTHPSLFGIWSGREMTSLFRQRPLLFNVLQRGRNCI